MWSEYSLEVVDAVAHRMPSAVSYTVCQLEKWLAVPQLKRHQHNVELTPAGASFIKVARVVIKKCTTPVADANR